VRLVRAACCLIAAAILVCACNQPASGSLKGVLVVHSPDLEERLPEMLDAAQRYVTTVDAEAVFDFSTCTLEQLRGGLRERRTVVFLVSSPEDLPGELSGPGPILSARNVWASGQSVFGLVVEGEDLPAALGDSLTAAYNRHMHDYVYGSFVNTQMSSPARMDSLRELGFTVDVPKSYRTEVWRPEDGFVQYQRQDGEECLLMLTIRWLETERVLESGEDAMAWRESVARRFFYDAGADSVDRAKTEAVPFRFRGLEGWKLTGVWRNPEYLNAGSFTSYILRVDERRFLLDMEVYHPQEPKEPYLREGWTIMDTFVPDGEDG
jgi:hypothetical protein